MLFRLLSKPFFATESLQESMELYDTLKQYNIRCTNETLHGQNITKHYSSDPFHVYAKSYLDKLSAFYVIRVHRMDYKKAMQIYNTGY